MYPTHFWGNCEFTGAKWKRYLTDKVLPTTECQEAQYITGVWQTHGLLLK